MGHYSDAGNEMRYLLAFYLLFLTGCASTPIVMPCVKPPQASAPHWGYLDLPAHPTYAQGWNACIISLNQCQAYADYKDGGNA